MGAATPEQALELLDAAFVAKDVEAIADLYEDDAVFANPPYWTAIGRAAIVKNLNKQFGATNAIEVVYDPLDKWVVADDYAFIHYTSLARITLADGSLNEVGTRTTIVAHRGADGFWRYILDHNSSL